MTCIIAHRDGWMVADRRVTFNGGLIGPYRNRKILSGPGILVGCAGDSVLRTVLTEAMASCTGAGQALQCVARAIRELPQQRGHALLVTREHGLVEIDSLGHCHELESEYWSIGSGYHLALGWLAGRCGGHAVRPEHAVQAISFASEHVNDVGDGTCVEVL